MLSIRLNKVSISKCHRNIEGHTYDRPFDIIEIDYTLDYSIYLRQGHYQVKTGQVFKFVFFFEVLLNRPVVTETSNVSFIFLQNSQECQKSA